MPRTWKDPYSVQIKADRDYRDETEGIQDGEYVKRWGGQCPRWPADRTAAYNRGFQSTTGQTPSRWDTSV